MDVVARIVDLCQEKGYTNYKLAKCSGLAYSSVHNMFQKHTTPSIYTLEKMCKGLDITLAQFFSVEDKYVDLTEGQIKILDIYTGLQRNEKELMIAYAQGLAKKI